MPMQAARFIIRPRTQEAFTFIRRVRSLGLVLLSVKKPSKIVDWINSFTAGFLAHEHICWFCHLVICVNLFIMDQQAGLAFLPVMVLSTVTASASLQGPSAASEDDDQEKWLDDKLQQISSLDFYDFLAFSKFNRR